MWEKQLPTRSWSSSVRDYRRMFIVWKNRLAVVDRPISVIWSVGHGDDGLIRRNGESLDFVCSWRRGKTFPFCFLVEIGSAVCGSTSRQAETKTLDGDRENAESSKKWKGGADYFDANVDRDIPHATNSTRSSSLAFVIMCAVVCFWFDIFV